MLVIHGSYNEIIKLQRRGILRKTIFVHKLCMLTKLRYCSAIGNGVTLYFTIDYIVYDLRRVRYNYKRITRRRNNTRAVYCDQHFKYDARARANPCTSSRIVHVNADTYNITYVTSCARKIIYAAFVYL